MAQFLQIVFINLVVSCDNISIIALATNNLPKDQAKAAQYIGIGLSMLCKTLFIGIAGYLFSITWLHIRIIGGAMLLYVTFSMLLEQTQPSLKDNNTIENDSFLKTIVSIVIADVSMSLDNVIAILGILVLDGHQLALSDYGLVISGFIVCLPILLWFSSTITKWMSRFSILTYLSAGYLVFTACSIIFEDTTIKLFLQRLNFSFTTPLAIIFGMLVVIYGLTTSHHEEENHAQNLKILIMYCVIVLSSLVMVGALTYWGSDGAVRDEPQHIQEAYRLLQQGIHSIYLIGMESEVFCISAAALSSILMYKHKKKKYISLWYENIKYMFVFIILYVVVATIGITYSFTLGTMPILQWLLYFSLLSLLIFTYSSICTMFSMITNSRFLTISYSLLFMFVETAVSAVCIHHPSLFPLGSLFPKFSLSMFVIAPTTPLDIIRIITISSFYILVSSWIGRKYFNKRRCKEL
ncbi:MAG: TerC family protein [Coprobacillaceae bacterium]